MPLHLKLSIWGHLSRVSLSVLGSRARSIADVAILQDEKVSRRTMILWYISQSCAHQPIRRIAAKRLEFRDEAMDEYGIKGSASLLRFLFCMFSHDCAL